MTHDELTPELRIEIQDNMMRRHLARVRRAKWEATKGKKTPVPVKRYNTAGDLVAVDGVPRVTRPVTPTSNNRRSTPFTPRPEGA